MYYYYFHFHWWDLGLETLYLVLEKLYLSLDPPVVCVLVSMAFLEFIR